MKEIKAYIRPNMADKVIGALEAEPKSPGLTVIEVRGYGHPRGGGPMQLTRRIKLELVVLDEYAEEVVGTIVEHAHTGNYGDGKIFVSDVEQALRIRTHERDRAAIQFPVE